MNEKLWALLVEEIALMSRAGEYLTFSYGRCLEISSNVKHSPEDLERFESLTSRYARLSDLLTQKIFRLIDRIDLDDQGTIRDRIYRAEKKGLIACSEKFIEIRELRNSIAHEYDPAATMTLYSQVIDTVPVLFDTISRVKQYIKKYE